MRARICYACQSALVIHTLQWTRAEYQEVNEYFPTPDLFVVFNSGMGYRDGNENTWNGALNIVFNHSGFKPLLLTSHGKEDSARDYAYLSRRQDCRFLMHPYENPFMSLRNGAAPPLACRLPRHVIDNLACQVPAAAAASLRFTHLAVADARDDILPQILNLWP